MIGEALRNSTDCRDDEDIGVAVVFASERDHAAIGREDRIGLNARARGQPSRVSAIPIHRPQIARVRKDNQIAVERRALQQRMRRLRGDVDRAKCGENRGTNHSKEWANQVHLFCSVVMAPKSSRLGRWATASIARVSL